MIVGIYSPELWDNKTPANVLGGVSRAKSARRDQFGRFLPQAGTLPAHVNHGVVGGKARSAQGKRDKKGRFVCVNI